MPRQDRRPEPPDRGPAGEEAVDAGTPAATVADEVTDAVLLASRVLVAVAARSIAAVDADVTLPQFRAVVVLATRGPQNVGALAEALSIHASTATRLCDRLVARDLVRRGEAEASRREVTVELSERGRSLHDDVTRRRRAEIAEIVARVPLESRATMVAALRTFADAAAGDAPEPSWSAGWNLP